MDVFIFVKQNGKVDFRKLLSLGEFKNKQNCFQGGIHVWPKKPRYVGLFHCSTLELLDFE